MPMIDLRCEHCAQPFTAYECRNRERRFCSKSCAVKHTNAEKFPPPVVLTCERPGCGVTRELPAWRAREARYCSRRCAGLVNGSANSGGRARR